MKAPLPKLRRKYEVDESHWLVVRSRAFIRRALTELGAFRRRAFFELRRAALAPKWGRVPRAWELSFIDRMRDVQKKGLSFDEVLRSTLPNLFGEDGSHVLRTWVGKKGRNDPERFARTVSHMFGASARDVLGSVDSLTDENSMLEEKAPQEPPYRSLLEAIQRSDAAAGMAAEATASQGTTPQRHPLTGAPLPDPDTEEAPADDPKSGG